MQFSQGRLEFQELYIGCPSAPPLGVDRFLAPRQDTSERTEASGVCGTQAEYVCCCHNLGLCPIGHTPCVRQARGVGGLGGSPFLRPGSSLPAQAHLC